MDHQQLQQQFSLPLLSWYKQHGRKDLPWKNPPHPYRVWVSEIMLQQTQVQTVIPYFSRFMDYYPSLDKLAQAEEDEVLSLWSGLGYYSRARNLHKTAQMIQNQYQGQFPKEFQTLLTLPGIGASTAAAIISQAFDEPTAILDGNVKRVLSRFFAISGWSEQAQVKKTLWELAQACMPKHSCADYTQAIMDLGALCCTVKKPSCEQCPVKLHCQAFINQAQELYPEKKVKKAVPQRQQQFLVLHNAEQWIYLEKRPPSGLWGGLWCLPSIEYSLCPVKFIETEYDLKGGAPIPLIEFKHKFTHVTLEIKALSIQTQAQGNKLSECRGKWFTKKQLTTLGLAKPTIQILSKFFDTRE